MLKQSLSQKLLQKLSPQQIQLMKLLQVPTVSLEQRIKEELEINPALEEGGGESEVLPNETQPTEERSSEEFEFDDYLRDYMDDDPTSYKQRTNNYGADEEERTIPVAVENTFSEHLEQQLRMVDLESEEEMAIAQQIIGSIDDDGYLRRDTSSIRDDLMFSQNIFVQESEIEQVLSKIQQFDPPGIAARDLQECLLIQLRQKLEREDFDWQNKEAIELAIKILVSNFEEFSRKHFAKLEQKLNITEEELKEAMDEILKLNPKPASGFSGGSSSRNAQYVVPDFIIINRDNELELTLNSRNAPSLHVNDHYQEMLKAFRRNSRGRQKTQQEKETIVFIKQKIDSAKWFIDAIRQRQQTMYTTMYAILQYQYDYFLTGDQKKLRPMILKDIADITGLDISTISRVVNSKYVQTEFGTKLLKDFFSESLQTEEGDEVSTLEVKKILQEEIGKENKRKPLSDEKLMQVLKDKGYNIARRTVAKYREQLNIPVARLRKEL